VFAGIWQQHQLWDGTYTVIDLFDVHEMMNVQAENERRMMEHQRTSRGGGA